MPTATDLVTDLPADFAVFGQGVDTSMAYLLGGTTGQILSKTSGTNMAFTWINNDQGDLTAITAGTGISVTSPTGPIPTVAIDSTVATLTGSQTLTNKTLTSPALTTPTISTLTTAGDMLVGTGSGAIARVAGGTSGYLLTSTGATSAPSWQAAAGGGKVLQVVTSTTATNAASTTNSYMDSNLTASITPSSASSKVLVLINQNYRWTYSGASPDLQGNLQIMRGATALLTSWLDIKTAPLSSEINFSTTYGMSWLDSPSTTSATTYKTQFKNTAATGTLNMNNNSASSSIVLLEIGA